MKSTSQHFKRNAHEALQDATLQTALLRIEPGFVDRRKTALDGLDNQSQLRNIGASAKERSLANLDQYLVEFETRVTENGGHVHWARSAQEANELIVQLCRDVDARSVIKGKSMVGEEIGLNDALEGAGLETIETDLGEYIIQLAQEPPSHIIAPAIHKTRGQIADLFREFHDPQQYTQSLESVADIVDEARAVMREKYLDADVGITGANFLIAETGSTVLVTNEGNGDLCSSLPDTHIIVTGIEKIVPTLDDASVLLRLLARNATGQELTSYTSFFTGARRAGDRDGPKNFHIVLVDNGRSDMLNNDYREMLRCIRCGACMNHCPVYRAVGGHAYGWVYPGPMGSVLTPLMDGLENSSALPNASTFCGRCAEVCPMWIPLPKLLRQLRDDAHRQHLESFGSRMGIALWAGFARRPGLYRRFARLGLSLLRLVGDRSGRIRRLPIAGGWTQSRDLPVPAGKSFIDQWRAGRRRDGRD